MNKTFVGFFLLLSITYTLAIKCWTCDPLDFERCEKLMEFECKKDETVGRCYTIKTESKFLFLIL